MTEILQLSPCQHCSKLWSVVVNEHCGRVDVHEDIKY